MWKMSEDLFLARSKAMNKELFMVIATVIVGLIAFVFIVQKGILRDRVITEDMVLAASKDVSTYITSLSTVDAGLQKYGMPGKMNIFVENNLVKISTGSISVTSEFSGNVKKADFTANEICIVKSTAGGQGEIFVCDVEDSGCCVPKIE